MEKALAPEAQEQNSARQARLVRRTEDKLHNLSAPKLAKQTLHGREKRPKGWRNETEVEEWWEIWVGVGLGLNLESEIQHLNSKHYNIQGGKTYWFKIATKQPYFNISHL